MIPRAVDDAEPSDGVVSAGEVLKTSDPEPVSSVTADARFAEDGVASHVATPVPRPDTPVEIGSPVALVRVPDEGVPSAPPFTTNAHAVPTFTPRAVRTPVPAPVSPVEIGSPVPFVRVTADGVPRFGVTSVGEVSMTNFEPVPV